MLIDQDQGNFWNIVDSNTTIIFPVRSANTRDVKHYNES